MNETELAMKMLQYGDLKATLDVLEAQIKDAVLERGKTQTVGSVRASYSSGRKSYDYTGAIKAALQGGMVVSEDLAPFEMVVPASVRTDYRGACASLGLEAEFTQSEPSVTVKLV